MDKGFMNTLRYSGFFRGEPRVIGGVCQGLAQRYGWDVNSVRILIVVLAFLFPVVCIFYAFAWVFLPEARDGRIHVDEMLKGRFDMAIVGAAFMAIFGGGALGITTVFFRVPFFLMLPAAIVIIAILLSKSNWTFQGNTMPQSTPDWRTQGGPEQFPGSQPSPEAASTTSSPFSASSAGTYPPPASDAPGPQMQGDQWRQQWNASYATSGHSVPQSAGTRFTPFPTQAPLLPRRLSRAAVLSIYGLVMLVLAGTFWLMYRNGLKTTSAADSWVQIGLIGGGLCLLIVGFAHLVAAIRDRSSAALSALSTIGIFLAIPAGLGGIGYAAVTTTDGWHWGNVSTSSYDATWKSDEIAGQNGSQVVVLDLDLTHAPDGLTKDIHVRGNLIPSANIQARQDQPVRVVAQNRPLSVTLDMNGDADWQGFNDSTPTILKSPTWKEGEGITVYLDAPQILNVNVEETGRSANRDPWPSGTPSPSPATPSPSASAGQEASPTPSASPNASESAAGAH